MYNIIHRSNNSNFNRHIHIDISTFRDHCRHRRILYYPDIYCTLHTIGISKSNGIPCFSIVHTIYHTNETRTTSPAMQFETILQISQVMSYIRDYINCKCVRGLHWQSTYSTLIK